MGIYQVRKFSLFPFFIILIESNRFLDKPKITRMNNPPKLLDQVRERIRTRHYSIRTEDSYVDWIKRFILFHGKHHPKELVYRKSKRF